MPRGFAMEKTKNLLLKSLFTFFIVFTVGLVVTQVAYAQSAGTVTFVTGDVNIIRADKTVLPAAKNAALNAGDAVETKNGRLQLSLIDGGKVSLQPNTIYKINKYEFSGKEDGSEYAFTELVKGGLRTISGLVGHKNRDRYQLKTAVATIGIRGTEFTVNFNDNQLLMTTNHGSVDVCNAGGCLNALTGQSIAVAGLGAAPKPSSKAAKAAAAPPASSKAVFAAGDQINFTQQAPAAVAPAPVGGSDTILSLATMPVNVSDNNGIYTGTTTFSGSSLTSYVDNSGTPNIVTGTILEANSDAFLKWGSASGGTYNGQSMLMTNWVVGVATPSATISSLNSAGSIGTYSVTGSTAPYIASSLGNITRGITNSVTGSMLLNFATYKLSYGLVVPISGNLISIAGNNVSLSAANGRFSDNNAVIANVYSTGPTITGLGILANNTYVEAALFGPNAERAGLQYGVNISGSGVNNGNLYGAVILTK